MGQEESKNSYKVIQNTNKDNYEGFKWSRDVLE